MHGARFIQALKIPIGLVIMDKDFILSLSMTVILVNCQNMG